MRHSFEKRLLIVTMALVILFNVLQEFVLLPLSSLTTSSTLTNVPKFPPRVYNTSVDDSWRNLSHSNISLPLCSRQQLLHGRWEPRHYKKPPYISHTEHLQCQEPSYYDEHGYDTYQWVPFDKSCRLMLFNKTEFCRLTHHATVSIIGDSLSWEHYSSMLQLLGARVHQTSQHVSKSKKKNHVQRVCSTRFVFRNDPRLENLTDSFSNDFPIILVLNRGPHYVNDTELIKGMEHTIVELDAWQSMCAKFSITCHLFWRTSVPGHPGCAEQSDSGEYLYSHPVNDKLAMERYVEDVNNYNNVTIEYHWHHYEHQNQLILKQLFRSNLSFTVLDAYELLVRRPDGHRVRDKDCLHNCYPGKIDVCSDLLLHHLVMQRSESDVQRLDDMLQRALSARQS